MQVDKRIVGLEVLPETDSSSRRTGRFVLSFFDASGVTIKSRTYPCLKKATVAARMALRLHNIKEDA